MTYKTRRYNCALCGAYTIRKRQSYDAKICANCGIEAMIASTRMMAAKSGPSWQKWGTTAGPRGRPRKSQEGT